MAILVPNRIGTEFKEVSNVSGLSYDVAPDGQRLLVLQPEHDDSEVRELHVVLNWFDELQRLAPTGKE